MVKSSELAWKTPCEVYNRTEELSLWFDGNKQAWFIANAFPESLLSDLSIPIYLRPKANKTAGNLGYVVLRDSKGFHQRGLHSFDPDAKLDGLQYALDHITLEKARLLWKFLLEHRHLVYGSVETSKYQYFSDSQRDEKFSEMGQLCNQQAWLPDTGGYSRGETTLDGRAIIFLKKL